MIKIITLDEWIKSICDPYKGSKVPSLDVAVSMIQNGKSSSYVI